MRKALSFAFKTSLPVLAGYIFLGMAFGLLLQQAGYGPLWAFGISSVVYAGSMQFVLVGLLSAPGSLLSAALITLTVNSRHLFYGISFVEKFKSFRKVRPYLIFALTDETYSLLCSLKVPPGISEQRAVFLLSLLNQLYWIAGGVLGALTGTFAGISTKGVEFSMTALFTVIFTEQWLTAKTRIPALLGLGCGALALIILGPAYFAVPALAAASGLLLLLRRKLPQENPLPDAKADSDDENTADSPLSKAGQPADF